MSPDRTLTRENPGPAQNRTSAFCHILCGDWRSLQHNNTSHEQQHSNIAIEHRQCCPASDIDSILWIMLELPDKPRHSLPLLKRSLPRWVQVQAKPESYTVGIFDTYEVTLYVDWIK